MTGGGTRVYNVGTYAEDILPKDIRAKVKSV